METATLAGGCFWCLEAAYQLIEGVIKVVPGYGGGDGSRPTYWSVHEGKGGYAESVQITYDPSIVSYEDLLDIFWAIHDPTTPNRQGNDVGPEYRSMILYENDAQKKVAKTSRDAVQKLWNDPVVTEIKKLDTFYEAEPEHHNYFKNHPEQAYCQVIINPKLEKLRSKFSSRIKK